MSRVVKIDVRNINIGTGFLISLDNDEEKDLVLTVCHIFGENKDDFWEMWDIESSDVKVTSNFYSREFKVIDILYKKSDAEEKDVALIYIEKFKEIIDKSNPTIPEDDRKFLNYEVSIEGYGQEATNDTTRVINGKIYDFINEEKKLYRVNYIESDRIGDLPTVAVNKGMSGAPAFITVKSNKIFIGMQKMVSSIESTDGILGVFTYKYCLELVKRLYNIELPLKSYVSRLINNDALFNNIHVIQQKFDIIPLDKEHIGASIDYDDIREVRDEFISELIDTIVDWVYSSQKYEELKQKSMENGKSEKAANSEIVRRVHKKFRSCMDSNIIGQGRIAELLLFHFIQRYLGAVPLLRKENIKKITNKESTIANVIHYKREREENIIVLGEIKSFSSKYEFKDVFLGAINSILNTYKNHQNEMELYVHEDFLDDEMNSIAEEYISKKMKNKKVHLVNFIMYNETCELNITDEDDIRNQIDSIIKERYRESENYSIDTHKNPILSRITHILFPVWGIEELAKLFEEYL